MWKGYPNNGLVFWTEEEIAFRERVVAHIFESLRLCLLKENPAFQFRRVEAPILTPRELINPGYSNNDLFSTPDETLVLRPETTMGSFVAATAILDNYARPKTKMPLVVWQHGKSFRREQDQPLTHMRLKEFYQLEFQILFAANTANDYATAVIPAITSTLSQLIGPCRCEASDRLPDYSEQTTDIIHTPTKMEVCSISKRKDFPAGKCLEVAIGTDRLIHCFANEGVTP